MPNRKKWFRKIVLYTLLLLVVLAAATVIAAKFWIIPGIIRDRVSAALAEYWDGKVEIGDVEFDLSGSAVLHDVKLTDRDGRDWLHVKNAAITLENWLGSAPMLTDANIDGFDIFAHFIDGECDLPIAESQSDSDEPSSVDLHSLTIANASFTKVDDGAPQPSEAFSLQCVRESDEYAVSFRHQQRQIAIDGQIVPKDEKVLLQKFSVSTEYGELISRLRASISVTGQANNRVIGIRIFYGRTGGRGILQGSAEISKKAGDYGMDGRMALIEASIPLLQKSLQGKAETTSGTITIQTTFACPDLKLENLAGDFAMFVDDIDSQNRGLAKDVAETIGVEAYDAKTQSDIEMACSYVWPVVVLKPGCHYSSESFAIEGEPGGTVNLTTKDINVYVVAAQFSHIRNAFSAIPILSKGPITSLLKKVFRLHIVGKWDDPADKLIHKEPLTDLAKGTVDFLKASMEGGGELGGSVLNLFDWSKGKNGNGSKTRPEE